MKPMSERSLKKATNISLDGQLLDEAKQLGVNVSRACEDGLVARVRELKGKQWLEENREALLSSNEYVEKYGLPLARHRMF